MPDGAREGNTGARDAGTHRIASGELRQRELIARLLDPRGQAAVANGVVYVPSHDTWLYALSAWSGQELWKAKLDRPEIGLASGGGGTPLVADGAVYVRCPLGLLRLKATTGRELPWSVRPPRALEVFSLVGGILYGGSCHINWAYDGAPTSASCPFLAFDPTGGKTLWQVADKGGFATGCAVASCLP